MIETEDQKSFTEFPSISICEKFPKLEVIYKKRPTYTRLPFINMFRLIRMNGVLLEKNIFKLNYKILLGQGKGGVSTPRPPRPPRAVNTISSKIKNLFLNISDESIKCIIYNEYEDNDCKPSFTSLKAVSQCRTYFSQISSDGKLVKRSVRKFGVNELEEDQSIVAIFAINLTEINAIKRDLPEKDTYVLVHQTKSPPNDWSVIYSSRRFILKKNKTYDLLFYKKTIRKLQNPYKTDCRSYESEINSTDIMSLSRDLCLTECVYDMVYEKYGCLNSGSNVIFGQKYSDYKVCNFSILTNESEDNIHEFQYRMRYLCHFKCKSDCIQEIYEYELTEVDNEFDNELTQMNISINSSDITYITLLSKHLGETSYNHLPKTKLTDFLCSLGGLCSLWLGLSVISIYDYLIFIFSKLITKTNY